MVRVVLGAHPRNLLMCTKCREYVYCCNEEVEANMGFQKKHRKVGGHRAECATLAAAGSVATIEGALEGEGAGMAKGKGEKLGNTCGSGRKTKCGKKGCR